MFFLCVLLHVHAIHACSMDSLRGKKMPTIIDSEAVDFAKQYSLHPFPKRFCHYKRSQANVFNFDDEPGRSACDNLVRGLDALQCGVSKSHFMSGSTDIQPKHDKVFQYTCYGSIGSPLSTYHDEIVPPEIKELDSAPSVTYARHVVTRTSFTDASTFKEDVNNHNPNKMHLSDLSALDLKLNENMHSAAYMAVNVRIFHTKLRANIEPTMEILANFKDLPEFSPHNIMEYFSFVSQYGTHINYHSYFGAKLLVLVYHNKESLKETKLRAGDTLAFNELINEALNMKQGKETKVSVFSSGGSTEIHKVETWIASVEKNPIPITYQYMPIHLFLTKGNRTSTSTGLEEMEKFEEKVNFLKRVSFEMRSFNPTNSLGKYVRDLLEVEIDQVCPSDQIVESVKAGISETANVHLTKYYIACMWYEDVRDKSYVQRKILYLIPGICVTIKSSIPKCTQMYYSTPENRDCFVFYELENCENGQLSHYIRTFDDAFQTYRKMKSMRLCSENE